MEDIKLKGFYSDLGWSALTEKDKEYIRSITKNRKFDFSHTYAVGKRCKFGYPQVLVCRPISDDLKPFPTLFWLICPYLEKKCGILESEQRISDVENFFADNLSEVDDYHSRYREIRTSFLSEEIKDRITAKNPALLKSIENNGVGGINWHNAPTAVKCLHLQTATLLGMKTHPAYKLLASMIGSFECENENCSTKI